MSALSPGSIFVTGASGFVGHWLLEFLRKQGRPVIRLGLEAGPASELGKTWLPLDLAQAAMVDPGAPVLDLDSLPAPAGLIHLAALSFPPACEADPPLARAVNVFGPARLYQQLLQTWPELPILHVSSGHVYQPSPDLLSEDQTLEPVNVYGATKLQGEAVALGLRDQGARISVVRPFNHTGAGQSAQFALPSFALRMAKLEQEGGGSLSVGRLDSVRDFLHVRQVVEAYGQLLPQAGEEDIVNLCSGQGQVIAELLEGLRQRAQVPVEIETDPARMRGSQDPSVLVGDPSRLHGLLGTQPTLDVEALLDELIDDARSRVAQGESLQQA
ncbi:MAG: NAD-dependent epimerase/dehydratase family protein [Planctomycetota bacterium]|nr:MAG: NAD-dependent epimerase/dehydratase family protein [Planctomycetota bacterium]